MFLSIGTARNLIIFSRPNTYVYYGIPICSVGEFIQSSMG